MNIEGNKTYSQMRRDFCEKFRKEILPTICSFENERKDKLKLAIFSSTGFSLIGILILLLLYINANKLSSDSADALFKLAMPMFVIAAGSWYIIKKDFEKKIKTKIMPTV